METLRHPPACRCVSQDGIWWRRALSCLAWVNSVHLVFSLSGYRCAPDMRMTAGRGTGVHKCSCPCCGSSHLRLAQLLDRTWLVHPPRKVARRDFVGPFASQLVGPFVSLGCSTGPDRSVCLAELLNETWLVHLPHGVARRDLVRLSAS